MLDLSSYKPVIRIFVLLPEARRFCDFMVKLYNMYKTKLTIM